MSIVGFSSRVESSPTRSDVKAHGQGTEQLRGSSRIVVY